VSAGIKSSMPTPSSRDRGMCSTSACLRYCTSLPLSSPSHTRTRTHTPTNGNSCFVYRCLSSLWLSTATPTLLSRRLPFRCYTRMRCPTVRPCQELTNDAAFYHQICRYRHCCLLVFPLNPSLCVVAPRVVPAYYTPIILNIVPRYENGDTACGKGPLSFFCPQNSVLF